MRLKKLVIVPLMLGIALTGCKDKKVVEDEVETAATAVEETESAVETVRETSTEIEREEKNTIAVVGNVNLRGGKTLEDPEETLEENSESKESEEETEGEKVDLRGETETETTENNTETLKESEEGEKVDLREGTVSEEKETEKEEETIENNADISGIQYQNFIADMNKLENYKYVGYDGDSSVFLNIDDNKETTSMLAIIYRDNSYIKDKFNGMEDLGDEQKKQIGADLVKELTGIDINITQTDFRERECKNGKYLGLPFGDSSTNNSGYLAFRIKKDKLECVIDTIDSTEPEDRKQMKDDVLALLDGIEFNGNECDSEYDIAFDNINIGIQKMKNGE